MLQKTPDLELEKRSDKSPTSSDDRVKCRVCGNLVSRLRWKASYGGHCHQFKNPLGLVYNVRCFDISPGVHPVGHLETDHTWFPGYGWTVVQCNDCETHMGWRFTTCNNTASSFFCLITERIDASAGTEGKA